MPPDMGIRMRASALRSTSSGRPAPSLPTRRATGSHQFISQGARAGWSAESRRLDASVRMFEEASCARRIGRAGPVRIGKRNAAPADARSALGENGLAVPLWPEADVTAPVAPNAAAVRRMVPTLPGSWTPARTTRSGAADFAGASSSSKETLRGSTSAATPCGCSVSAMPSKRRSVV